MTLHLFALIIRLRKLFPQANFTPVPELEPSPNSTQQHLMNQLLCCLCLSGHSSLRLNERSLTVMTQVSLDLTFTSPQSPTLPLHIDDSLPKISQMCLKLVLSAARWWTTQFSGYPSCKSPLPPAGIPSQTRRLGGSCSPVSRTPPGCFPKESCLLPASSAK